MYREKHLKNIQNAILITPVYPNCKINGQQYYDEQIMSMPSLIDNSSLIKPEPTTATTKLFPGTYFFFIYNLDNYYHFLYDTLPYLYFYFELIECKPKLLFAKDHKLLQFQLETFEALGLTDKIVFAEDGAMYEQLYIPSSLTHGRDASGASVSNLRPSPEALTVWQRLAATAITMSQLQPLPSKIYISRRTWVHNNTSNIGTNYTTRRRCLNEDELVPLAQKYGYQEVFCENMSMYEKIQLFANATHVLGFIGGGLANLLFSPTTTTVACINTPDFLRINSRFVFSMNHTNIQYLSITSHAMHNGPWPLYTRVKIKKSGLIGEICEWIDSDQKYVVNVSNNDVAGFAFDKEFAKKTFMPAELEPLDNGLNSPFVCDLNQLEKYLIDTTKECK